MSLLDTALSSLKSSLPQLPGSLTELFHALIAQDSRLIEIHFARDSGIGEGQFLVHRLRGHEGINFGFHHEIWVLSQDAHVPLKSLEGVPVQIGILTDGGGKRLICGVITEVHSEGSDGGLATYRLVVEPLTAALRLGRSSRIFLQKSDLEIVQLLLNEQIQFNSVFGAAFTIDNRCLKTYPQRDFVFLCDENKWDFIRRRLAKIGVSFVIAPSPDSTPEHPQHTLILFDDPRDLDENEAGSVRFHRADGTERHDTITGWQAQRSLQVGKVSRRTWDHSSGALSTTSEELLSDQGAFGNALASTLEDYRHEAPLEHDELQGHEKATTSRAQVWEQRTKGFSGEGTVRDFRVGTSFVLEDHPVHEDDPEAQRTFVLTALELEAENNFGGLKTGAVSGLSPDTAWGARGGRRASSASGRSPSSESDQAAKVYTNHFTCLRQGIPILPEELEAPAPGLQTATVVGPEGEEVHTDEVGRIKVQLHSLRPEDHAEAGVTGTDRDSTWVRLLQPWSSQGMGGGFLPRAGDEVLIQFLNNDPDKPVILGVLPGGQRKPATFSLASSLPGDKAISGMRSKMHKGSGGNELLFDDSTNELRTRLASDHAKTELNLGYIVHPRALGVAEPKGEGAELRTEAAAAVRGEKGLLLSTEASGSQLGREVALGNLDAALGLSKTLGEAGTKHGTDTLETQPQEDLLKALGDWEKGTNTAPKGQGEGRQAVMLASAPAGMALSSSKATTLQAGTNLDLAAMGQAQLSAGKKLLLMALESISLFAHKLGMKLIAASGDMSLQAQDGRLEAIAAKDLNLMSVDGMVVADSAKGILLRSGGAYILIKDGKIEYGAPGDHNFKGATFRYDGPASQNALSKVLPKSEIKTDEHFVLMDAAGGPVGRMRYRVIKEGGEILEGVSDPEGRTSILKDAAMKSLRIEVMGPEEA